MTPERIAELDELCSNATVGPWQWRGNLPYNFILQSRGPGIMSVMDFVRLDMKSAQPRFPVNGLMEKATDLARFQVGDPKIVGYQEAKKDPSVYRYDVSGIAHPDAEFIAKSRTALPECLEEIKRLNRVVEQMFGAFRTGTLSMRDHPEAHSAYWDWNKGLEASALREVKQ